MVDLMMDLAQKNRQTVIIVTHDLEISVYADRIIHLMDGKVDNIKVNENRVVNSSELAGIHQ